MINSFIFHVNGVIALFLDGQNLHAGALNKVSIKCDTNL